MNDTKYSNENELELAKTTVQNVNKTLNHRNSWTIAGDEVILGQKQFFRFFSVLSQNILTFGFHVFNRRQIVSKLSHRSHIGNQLQHGLKLTFKTNLHFLLLIPLHFSPPFYHTPSYIFTIQKHHQLLSTLHLIPLSLFLEHSFVHYVILILSQFQPYNID